MWVQQGRDVLLGGSGSQLQQAGPSERAGPGSGAACGANPLLHCWPQRAVPVTALPAPAHISSVSVPTMILIIDITIIIIVVVGTTFINVRFVVSKIAQQSEEGPLKVTMLAIDVLQTRSFATVGIGM